MGKLEFYQTLKQYTKTTRCSRITINAAYSQYFQLIYGLTGE